jgi:hypothetical protein
MERNRLLPAKSYKLDVIKVLRGFSCGMRCLEKVKNEWKTGAA